MKAVGRISSTNEAVDGMNDGFTGMNILPPAIKKGT
jgi:hypothetical protein